MNGIDDISFNGSTEAAISDATADFKSSAGFALKSLIDGKMHEMHSSRSALLAAAIFLYHKVLAADANAVELRRAPRESNVFSIISRRRTQILLARWRPRISSRRVQTRLAQKALFPYPMCPAAHIAAALAAPKSHTPCYCEAKSACGMAKLRATAA